jgi:rubrerythrin
VNGQKATLKEVYGKGVRAMANTKAPMMQGSKGMKGGVPTVAGNVKHKATPPGRTGKPFMCPTCNYRGNKAGYCPMCGTKMAKSERKRGPVATPSRY